MYDGSIYNMHTHSIQLLHTAPNGKDGWKRISLLQDCVCTGAYESLRWQHWREPPEQSWQEVSLGTLGLGSLPCTQQLIGKVPT